MTWTLQLGWRVSNAFDDLQPTRPACDVGVSAEPDCSCHAGGEFVDVFVALLELFVGWRDRALKLLADERQAHPPAGAVKQPDANIVLRASASSG